MWRPRWDPGILKAEALALLPCGLGMAFSQSHVMAARRHQHGRLIIEVDEYSSNPTQAFTFYNINQGRFQPPHVQMVDPVPHDAPKPPGYTRFVCVSDTHSRTDPIQMPYGDVLIHAGDFTELGLPSEVKKFNEWLALVLWLGIQPPERPSIAGEVESHPRSDLIVSPHRLSRLGPQEDAACGLRGVAQHSPEASPAAAACLWPYP
uniref:Metallophosphoesterase domain containing 1 n=1 Tax=Cricetulus griseus TaxID=10029 RepID=A0A8C2MY03_CRIGR